MAITDYRIEEFSSPVSKMPDNPTKEGLSAEEIKAWFDSKADNEIKTSINGIIDHIDHREKAEKLLFEMKADKDKVIAKDCEDDFTPTAPTHPVNKGYVDNALEAFADFEEERVDLLIGNKADAANVICKDSVEAFTPTAPTHPVNKAYVDNALNEKITEMGGGDMMQSVYDTSGRKRDIFSYIDEKYHFENGVLPVAFGGTGAVNTADARAMLEVLGKGKELTNENLDETGEEGFYFSKNNNSCLNTPEGCDGNPFGMMVVRCGYAANFFAQVFFDATSGSVHSRVRKGSNGHNWKMINTINITSGTGDLTSGTSALATGDIYQMYI